ncbi:MAG: MBL fold metallo-hydrolase [Planctomycetota bacterium]
MRLGKLEIYPVCDGYFKLDGGAMFGVVPKPLWSKRMPADENNRIQMALFCLLIQTEGKNILVNTGIGPDEKYPERFRQIYDIRHPPTLLTSLAEHHLKPEDINLIILTHLHFDHAGGNTSCKTTNTESQIPNQNNCIPAFPNAPYLVQKTEWEDATNPTERTRASYRPENIRPLKEHGVLQLLEGNCEIVPGVKVKITGGHTRGHQVILFESEGKKGIFWSDLIPTTAHIDLPYIMGYDLYPEETLNAKKELIEQAVAERWLCFWEHDPTINCGYLIRQDDRVQVIPYQA